MNKVLPAEIISQIQERYIYEYIDNNYEGLGENQMMEIIEGDPDQVLDTIYMSIWETNEVSQYEYEIIKGIIDDNIDYFRTEDADLFDDDADPDMEVAYLDISDRYSMSGYINIEVDISSLYDKSKPKIVIPCYTDKETILSNWDAACNDGYAYDDLKSVLRIMGLNPKMLKKYMLRRNIRVIGEYPDIEYEDYPVISYGDMCHLLENTTSNGNTLTFVCTADLNDFINNNPQKPQEVKISKGTYCTLFDAHNGGGSIMVTTVRDIVLPLTGEGYEASVRHDYKGRYSVEEVYGGDYYYQEIQITKWDTT